MVKNTKYLFDENQTPEGMISVSQIQSFMACRKKWFYGYVEEITPRVDKSYLTIGKLCHAGMQTAMDIIWQGGRWERARDFGVEAITKHWDLYMYETPLLAEEIPEMNQMLDDAISIFKQAFWEFEPWKYEVLTVYKDGIPMPALELHFKVPCPPTKGLHGYIDAILKDKETGFVWCVDYKFRKSLAPDEDEAFNIQNSVYAYACAKMGIQVTGSMTWQHCNTPAADPAILKDGSISKAKIKTTWAHYKKFCEDNGVDPTPYEEEMTNKLKDIEWFRATTEYRNTETVARIWAEVVAPAAMEIKKAHGKNPIIFRSLYPFGCRMCQYSSLCQAELRDYDAEGIRRMEFTKRKH